jgi:Kef-type K+ transport system membrane component KefB
MLDLFSQLTFIIVLAAFLGILARWAKQPTILAYLIAGILVGIFGYFDISQDSHMYQVFSDLGIMFILFLVGLEINYSSLRSVGRDAFLIGLGQVVFTFIVGFLLALSFNFPLISAAFISIALTFSSTIIVVNLLSEKKDLNGVYGKISLGILLVQDLVVIMTLILLAGGSGEGLGGSIGNFFDSEMLSTLFTILLTLLKGFFIFFIAFILGRKTIPSIFASIARSPEVIFLTSLAWLFSLTWVIDLFGFSKEIGGFLAGLTLANSYEHYQIASRIKSLKDFFILVFFVVLGSSLVVFSDFSGVMFPIIVFSLFILVGNPFIVFLIMTSLGYTKRPAFFAGITIAQISEFSLVLAALGVRLGHIPEQIAALITSVGVITIISSTYLILNAEKLYKIVSPYLSFFERVNKKHKSKHSIVYKKPIILVGFSRTGQSIAYNLPKEDILIVDYDPEMTELLKQDEFAHIFGEMADVDVLSLIDFSSVKIVVSTAPDLESNIVFLKEVLSIRKKINGSFRIIIRVRTDRDAEILYRLGADYVLLPHTTAGRFLAKIISQDPTLSGIASLREKDLHDLMGYKRKLG